LIITFASAKSIVGAAASGYPPLQYHDEKGEFVGYDVDFLNEVGNILGYKIEWQHPKYDGVLAGVQSGNYDFAPGFVETKARKTNLDFTNAYFQGNYSVFVTNENSKVKTTKQLDNATIAVVVGSFQSDLIDQLHPNSKRVTLQGNEDIVVQVVNNKVDAGILPYTQALKIKEKYPNLILIGNEIPDTGARIAVKKGNKELLDKLNSAIASLRKNGIQKKLHEKWYSNVPYRDFD
jgi:polar amino acid transport system substrate-binding protein